MVVGDRKFKDVFKSYSRTSNLTVKISRLSSGRLGVPDHVFWGCILFTRLSVVSRSLKKLLDHDCSKEYKYDWDYASAFSLTRNIMECYQTLFYLSFDNVSQSELEARKALFNIHDYYSRKQFFSFFPENFNGERENIEIENLVLDKLKNSEYFQTLDEKTQKKYLKGGSAFFSTREEIEEKEGMERQTFRYWYKFLSSNIHSYPMGFFRMIDCDRGTGAHSEVEESYCAMALELAESYLIRGCINMLNIFPDILERMSPQEKKLLCIE